MASDLLNELHPVDNDRYEFYLRELKKHAREGKLHTRRDFFRHMGKLEKLPYERTGGFMRKYRPMFEAAVPQWAALANQKLRDGFAKKKEVREKQRRVSNARLEESEEVIHDTDNGSSAKRRARRRVDSDSDSSSDSDPSSDSDTSDSDDDDAPPQRETGDGAPRQRYPVPYVEIPRRRSVPHAAHAPPTPTTRASGTSNSNAQASGSGGRAHAHAGGTDAAEKRGPKRRRLSNTPSIVVVVKDEPEAEGVPNAAGSNTRLAAQRPTPASTPDGNGNAQGVRRSEADVEEMKALKAENEKLKRRVAELEAERAANVEKTLKDKEKIIYLHEQLMDRR